MKIVTVAVADLQGSMCCASRDVLLCALGVKLVIRVTVFFRLSGAVNHVMFK